MINQLINKLKELLKDIWEDFKDPVSFKTEYHNCCSSTAFYKEDNLQPELIRINQNHEDYNNHFKNNQS